ncbi:MAG: hypothetical protein AAF802_11875 [Planctomycetota bacterium]
MFRKIMLAAAVIAGSAFATQSTADAFDCYGPRYRGTSFRAPVYNNSFRVPVRSYGAYRAPLYGPVGGFYGVSRYSSFRSPYIGPGVGFGYSSFGPYRRSGISIGFGF